MLLNKFYNSLNSKWLSLHLVVLFEDNVRHLAAQIGSKLTRVQLAYDNAFVLTQHFVRVARERMNIVELC